MAAAAPAAAPHRAVVWRPQAGPQTALITCPVFEVFYGGARGGGKTDGMLGEFIRHAADYGRHAIGLMVRRTYRQLAETIERSRAIYTPLGAKLVDDVWKFPDGARLRFAYLERDADADNYQGHSYTRIYVEELGNFPDPKPIFKLMATLRSAEGVRCGFRATGNPGGPGHQWIKARYIDPAPQGWQILADSFVNPFTHETISRERVYIPSRLGDNRKLMEADPGYVAGLMQSGSPELVRAWLEGDWSVITGAYFPEFSMARHIIQPLELPKHWKRFRAIDWGSARPASVAWWAIASETIKAGERVVPRGALVCYREWYVAKGPNEGLKMTAEEVGSGILQRQTPEESAATGDERIAWGVCDPAMYIEDGGPSIAERMSKIGCHWVRGDNKRLPGWDQLRQRLKGIDGNAMIFWFSTCTDSIRTIPALQHDEKHPEDIDTDGEDHAGDQVRYACMSRPMMRVVETQPKPVWDYQAVDGGKMQSAPQPGIREFIERRERERRERE